MNRNVNIFVKGLFDSALQRGHNSQVEKHCTTITTLEELCMDEPRARASGEDAVYIRTSVRQQQAYRTAVSEAVAGGDWERLQLYGSYTMCQQHLVLIHFALVANHRSVT